LVGIQAGMQGNAIARQFTVDGLGERLAYDTAATPLDVALERTDVTLDTRHRAGAWKIMEGSCARTPRTSTWGR
jgi:hypothetical protein